MSPTQSNKCVPSGLLSVFCLLGTGKQETGAAADPEYMHWIFFSFFFPSCEIVLTHGYKPEPRTK